MPIVNELLMSVYRYTGIKLLGIRPYEDHKPLGWSTLWKYLTVDALEKEQRMMSFSR